MLNAKEILDLLEKFPKGYLRPDHNIFTASNTNLLETYKKLGAISNKEDEQFNDSHNSCSANEIFCNVLGCSMIFDSVASYQSHYNVMHRFICAECKKSMPTEHLLDLHISEHHDSYFKARVDRGERLFKCYLEECKQIFENAAQRKEHCIKEHRFPSNFRFDQMVKNGQHKKVKASQNSSKQTAMEDVEVLKHKEFIHKELKMISFGHQKERTFRPRNGPKPKPDVGKTLESMDTLKEALELMN
ncbi:protein lethal(2)k10201 [Lucilia cuprina]|uniref:protein lethal(2)k10201 n=1 Tax=Lucilia cuprina TaxID=7375 RepID=UPI001F057E5F|nr:protein lethal(2)k10201 [Lucilia cuprina]